jgi:hypothetical protein
MTTEVKPVLQYEEKLRKRERPVLRVATTMPSTVLLWP